MNTPASKMTPGLDERDVSLVDRSEQQATDARVAEDGFNDDNAAQQETELQPDDRDHGKPSVSHRVVNEDPKLGEPLGSGGSHVVLLQHLQEGRTNEARISG